MKKSNIIKTLSLLILLVAGNGTLKAQGFMIIPGDGDPPIGVYNLGGGDANGDGMLTGFEKNVEVADQVGDIFNRDNAIWDLEDVHDAWCYIVGCDDNDPDPEPDPNPPVADTSGTGGGNGGGGSTPPPTNNDDDKEEEEEAMRQSNIMQYLSAKGAKKNVSLQISKADKPKAKAYFQNRLKSKYWKKEGRFYTYFNRINHEGKTYFHMYITDIRPNRYKPVPAAHFIIYINQGKMTFAAVQKYTNAKGKKKKMKQRR